MNVRKGSCINCGRCCSILQFIVSNPSQDDMILWDLKGCNRRQLKNGSWLLEFTSKCKHLDKDNKCSIYNNRPDICKKYPEENGKEFLPSGCGYSFG